MITLIHHSETERTYLSEEGEIRSGEPRVADLAGVPVLLTRTDHGIIALADRCTHRGAPLHEGELAELGGMPVARQRLCHRRLGGSRP